MSRIFKTWAAFLTLAALIALSAATAQAGAGDLDHTFGSNGFVSTNTGGNDYLWSIAIDGSGRFIVA